MKLSTLYRAKKYALLEVHGGHDVSYSKLLTYCEVIKEYNPGSLAHCAWLPTNHVERPLAFSTIFIAFKGCVEGLIAGCRSLIGVDRRYCCKHLSKNFKAKFPGPLLFSYFWMACGAYSPFTFKKAMDNIQKVNHLALVWLADVGPQSTWTIHKFQPVVTSDVNKNNFVESFNSTLGVDRCRPVLTLLEAVRRVTMVRMATRRQKCEEWTREDLCPNIIKKLQVTANESRTCHAYPSREGEYEVLDGKSYLPVSLNKRECKCGRWQLSGLPCKHAMRAILHTKLDPHSFASQWFTVEMYRATYSHSINSLPDSDQWPEISAPAIQPPIMKRGVGRPARNRRREEDEQRKGKRSKTVKCSLCQEFGHNAATCKGGLTKKDKARKGQNKKTKSAAENEATTSKEPPTKITRSRAATQEPVQPTPLQSQASKKKKGPASTQP